MSLRKTIQILSAVALLAAVSGCALMTQRVDGMSPPTLFVSLDETCNVPDGMTLDANNNIILSVPNYVDHSHGGKLVKINKFKDVSLFYMLPPHPETGQVHPMGLEMGPDGNIYVADNQYFLDQNYKSRLLRVNVVDGEAVGCDVVVEGFKLANAVRWKGKDVYVSDTFFDLPDKKHQSGIYRISLAEMNAGKVSLLPEAKDPHLLAQFSAKPIPEGENIGADGVCFDRAGNLYTGNFGDGVISKLTFDLDGNVTSQKIIVDDPTLECCDGIVCDEETGKIYITNSKENAIHVLNTADNSLSLMWINDDDDGATGLLDQPCEPLLKGNKLIVANFDYKFPGLKNSVNDAHHTLSVFRIK